ncbi:hypothetical protein Ciccas_006680 [Cichlidogyrus casuarinus]|uniref:BHLH domain-containing protein n=1 Tax=Cichlidogyrus casuarinus TaxID=1844966 RepID=A0ABD2Q540_9PLAT
MDHSLTNHNNLINSLNSCTPANLSTGTGKRSTSRNNSSHSSQSYDNSMSLWSNDLPPAHQDSVPPQKKSNKKESHNRIERKRRDYINAQIACLGNLLPPELYRDVSEGKRNKGSVLKLSVNYIHELQNTLNQMGNIQQENQLARQLIPLLVRRVKVRQPTSRVYFDFKTLQKALADLVEAIPHCLDVRLDDVDNDVKVEDNDRHSHNDPFADDRPDDLESLAPAKKRPRRLLTAFQQAKSELEASVHESRHKDSSELQLNGMHNNQQPQHSVYEEEYQSWMRLCEFNQKQELQQQQLLSVSTPGANSTSAPCSISSSGSSNQNNASSFTNGSQLGIHLNHLDWQSCLSKRACFFAAGRRGSKLNCPLPLSTVASSTSCGSPLNAGRIKLSSLGEVVSQQPSTTCADLKLMYTSNLLPQGQLVGSSPLDCLMTSVASSSCHSLLLSGELHFLLDSAEA